MNKPNRQVFTEKRLRLSYLLDTLDAIALHIQWTDRFMAEPSLIGVIDSYGIELIHPRREGRSSKQIGKRGLSNKRWIVGGKLGLLLKNLGLIVDWDINTSNVYDGSNPPNKFRAIGVPPHVHLRGRSRVPQVIEKIRSFQQLVGSIAEEMLVFADPHFEKKNWNPTNLKICPKRTWNERMMIETVLSMMTTVCHF